MGDVVPEEEKEEGMKQGSGTTEVVTPEGFTIRVHWTFQKKPLELSGCSAWYTNPRPTAKKKRRKV